MTFTAVILLFSTQVVYFTAIFPYFILFALLINNIQLPGAKNGILFFATPVWNKLFEVKVSLVMSLTECMQHVFSQVSDLHMKR